MIRGLYTATTGMMVQRSKMDVLTNNIVNAETTGYKSDDLMTSTFDAEMLKRISDPDVSIVGTNAGKYSFGTHVDEKVTDFTQGDFEDTGRNTDLALSGEGFFVIETPEGERYTRSGNFTVDEQGNLVTSDGNYVLGSNGRIHVGDDKFSVSADGVVTGDQAVSDQLRLVTFADTGNLRKQGNNLYYSYNGEQPAAATDCTVRQGAQEASNVSVADSMVDMLTVYRKYEACQKAVTMNDETLGLAVNKLGRLGG
jgi:flagellar basal-body rod protein FlgG